MQLKYRICGFLHPIEFVIIVLMSLIICSICMPCKYNDAVCLKVTMAWGMFNLSTLLPCPHMMVIGASRVCGRTLLNIVNRAISWDVYVCAGSSLNENLSEEIQKVVYQGR